MSLLLPADWEQTAPEVMAEIRADRLMSLGQQYMPGPEPTDAYLARQVAAAEAELEEELRVFLTPVEVLPAGASDEERAAFDDLGIRWIEEPGYDWTPATWRPDSWAYTVLRHAPVAALHSIQFVYPRPTQEVFDVPEDWIRLDRKIGHIRLFPTGAHMSAPFSGFWGHRMLGGRTVPQMIQVRYRAGLDNALALYPQLYDLILKRTTLMVLQDRFVPQSGSISADGLSQSFSLDLDKHGAALSQRVNALRDLLHGVRCMVI